MRFNSFFGRFRKQRRLQRKTRHTRRRSGLHVEPLERRELLSNDLPSIVAVLPADGATVTNSQPSLVVTFSENVQTLQAVNISNYLLFNGRGSQISIDGASYSSPVLASIGGMTHAVFFTRDGVVVLDPHTGDVRFQMRWRARIEASVNAATPLIVGDSAFFSTSYDTGALLLKLRKDGADKLWDSDELMTNHYNTSIAKDGHLYGFHGRQEAGASFRCVDLKTKKVIWERPRFGCASMILADDKLILLTEQGELLLVEATPAAYRELARGQAFTAGPCRAQIALANGRLYARDQKKLACFDVK